MPGTPNAQDAVVRLRFDTTGARQDLEDLDRRVDRTARGGARGGPGGGGGIIPSALSALGGLGGGGLAGLGIASTALAPIFRDLLTPIQAGLGSIGEIVSGATGIKGWAGTIDAARQAQQDTVSAFGIAGSSASRESIQNVYRSFQRLRNQEQAGRVAVENATAGFIGEAAAEPFMAIWREIRDTLKERLPQPAPPPNPQATGATPGAG